MSAAAMSESPMFALSMKPDLPARKLTAGGLAIGFHLLIGASLLLNWQAPMPPAPPPASIRIAMIVSAPQPVAEPVTAAPEPAPQKKELPRPIAPPSPERAELAHKRMKPETKAVPETAPREDRQESQDDTVQREAEAQRQADQQRTEQRAREAAEQAARVRQMEAERLAASRQYLPIEKKAPAYPQRALDKNIEGSCTVSYTVNAMGRVEQPQVVGDCHPLFIRPSLEAARGFRYEPRVIDGRAVAVPDVNNTFQYRIAQGVQ
ncbi:protein TonB [Oxalicibacterium flavum]|uniref:Protein TonB n=1 Tax=Oxalicibacterium flavum TaxID=179467 RepID=A0A8J2UJW0_9BURK|nr:energy transducer TonB [Oxalicibacterium flavum]GGB98509.1 protein TonB [Oxalicibacterium flavum]